MLTKIKHATQFLVLVLSNRFQ